MKLYCLASVTSLFTTFGLFAQQHAIEENGELPLPPPPEQSLWQMLFPLILGFILFYVLLWRPEQKRRKALEDQRSALKQGDRVVAMGIIGTVLRVAKETVILKMYDGAKIECFKGAITEILPPLDEASRKESEGT